jgi:ABC-type transport system involved in cytochrome bd biosynthesis fused ATPase/permease subunit
VIASLVVDHVDQSALIDRLATRFADIEVLRVIHRVSEACRFDRIQFVTSNH